MSMLIDIIGSSRRRGGGAGDELLDGLAGWWLDPAKLALSGTDRWSDSSASSHNLTLDGPDPNILATGGPGGVRCVEFPTGHTGNRFSLTHTDFAYDRASTNRTITTWVWWDTADRGFVQNGFEGFGALSGAAVDWFAGSGTTRRISGASLENWFFLVLWLRPTKEVRVRLNTASDSFAAVIGTPTNDSAGLVRVGNCNARLALEGRMSTTTIHNRILTDAEVDRIYNSGTPLPAADIGL